MSLTPGPAPGPVPERPDALRLAFGTLTALPVPPPSVVDPRTAGTAMLLAPLVGLALGVPLALAVALLAPVVPALLLAVLATAALAVATRGMHLDGLADTADGLGSNRLADGALEVMRRSDIGPFGVVTLVLALLAQVAALAACLQAGVGPAAVLAALVVSRTVLPLVCTPGWPAARADGLGATVAGTVPVERAFVSLALALLAVVAGAAGVTALTGGPLGTATLVAALAPLALVAGLALARHCRGRFGGITGDVLGAAVETTYTAALVLAACA